MFVFNIIGVYAIVTLLALFMLKLSCIAQNTSKKTYVSVLSCCFMPIVNMFIIVIGMLICIERAINKELD